MKKNTSILNLDPRLKYWHDGKLNNGVTEFALSDSGIPSEVSPPRNEHSQANVEIKTASQVLAEQSLSHKSSSEG
jgi:hypothetical protein